MRILEAVVGVLDLEAPVREICQGGVHTAVWTREVGLAATLPRDALCGTQVVNPDVVLRCVSQGANIRQIRGTRRLNLMR